LHCVRLLALAWMIWQAPKRPHWGIDAPVRIAIKGHPLVLAAKCGDRKVDSEGNSDRFKPRGMWPSPMARLLLMSMVLNVSSLL